MKLRLPLSLSAAVLAACTLSSAYAADIYAGAGGTTVTGTISDGIYGGYSSATAAASGQLTIGSTTFGTATTVTEKIAGANYALGTVLSGGAINSTVLSTTLIQGSLTESQIFDASRNLKSDVLSFANTQITGGKIYGGGSNAPAPIYGSVDTTLKGIYLLGDNTITSLAGDAKALVAGGDVGSVTYGNVKLTISNSYINSKVFGTGATINGNLTYNFSNSYFAQEIILGSSSATGGIAGAITFTDVGSTFAGLIQGARNSGSSISGNLTITLDSSKVVQHLIGGVQNGGAGTMTGDVTITLKGSTTIAQNVYAGGSNSGNLTGNVAITLEGTSQAGSTASNGICGGLSGGSGITSGNVTITLKDSSKTFTIWGASYSGKITGDVTVRILDSATVANMLFGAGQGSTLTGNVDITVGGTSTVAAIYGGGQSSTAGDVKITIEGTPTIGNFRGAGRSSSVQNVIIKITGGTIGAGKTGGADNMFFVSGQNAEVKGTATLTMSGGSIQNEIMILGGVDVYGASKASITGLASMNVSGGSIESNIRATSGWGSFLGGDVDIKLSGGTFGKAGQTRSIDMGIAEGDWSGAAIATPVKGNVKITLDGGSSGQGSTFLGTYSILAGATLGSTGVVGSTTVTLQNVTSKAGTGGVANFAGVISGANNSGTGAGASRSLIFSNYTTETGAQFKYFTAATVKDASNVLLKGTGTSIASWTVSDTSTLAFQSTDSLGGATAISLANGATLKYLAASGAANDNLSASTAISGGGSLVIDTSATSNSFGISNANTGFTGTTTIAANSSLVLRGAGTLGTGQININEGATLDMGSITSANTVNVTTVAKLLNFNHYAGVLTINGAAGKTTTATGGLSAMKLNLTTANAKVTVGGNLVVQNGGSFYLDAANIDQSTALIAVSGTASMGGEFKIVFNTDDYYTGDSLVYNVVSSANDKVANYNNSLAFTVDMPDFYKRFFSLKSTCVEDFMNTGKLYVVIDRLVVKGSLITYAQGGTPYVANGPLYYLGAAEGTLVSPVEFTASYAIAANDDAYRLTNGLGWLAFNSSTQLKDINASTPTALVISSYTDVPTASDDRGVIMLNKENTYTGGTVIFNVIVKSDASGATGEVKTFSSGEISLLGSKADFVLTGDPTADYSYENDFRLTDGAAITQESGANTLNGDIYIATQGAGGSIANTGDETLTLTGKLSGGKLTVQGDGETALSGSLATADRTLTGLSLIDSADFQLTNGASLSVGTLSTEADSDIWVNTDTDFTISGGSAIGDGNINLNGGTLHVTKSLGLNGAGQTKLVFHPEPFTLNVVPGNVIDVASGSTLTVTNATANADTSFTKIGTGTLTFTGDSSGFLGTAKAREGLMNVFATTGYDFGGNLEVGGGTNDSRLIIQNGVVVKGDITVHEKGTLSTSNNFTLEGDLTLDDNTSYYTDGKASYMGDITLGKNVKMNLAEGSLLGYDGATISLSEGSVFNFGPGAGSQFAGVLDGGGITFTKGSVYEGFLNANGNNVTFAAGSIYNVSGSMRYKTAGSFTGALQSKETISLNSGMEFKLDNNFTVSSLERYTDGFCLMSVNGATGKILYNGTSITENGDYSNLLGANPYQWLQFSLIGGTNGKTLDLGVFTRAEYEGLAATGNEKAIVPVANELANNFADIDNELKQLAGALALATGNGKEMLSNLALSTSSAMVGYQVQIDNLRRHAFDILNRAVQEQTGAQRLSYEQDQNTIWANAVGGTYQLDDDSNSLGNTTTLWGGTLGFSRAVGEDLAMGLAFTYTNSQTDLNNGFGKSTGDAYYIDAFARYNKDNWNVVGILTGGFTSVDVERNLSLGSYHGNTKGSADGSQFYALLQAGYQFAMSDDNRSYVEPFALITGGYSSLDGFDETGAGNAGLSVDSQSQGLCTIGAGVRFFRDFYTDTNELHRGRFEARAMVLQDMIDSDVNVDAGFIGLPSQRFSQEGMSPGRTAFVIGTGVVVPISVQTSIFGDVDAEFRTSETGVRANIGVKVAF